MQRGLLLPGGQHGPKFVLVLIWVLLGSDGAVSLVAVYLNLDLHHMSGGTLVHWHVQPACRLHRWALLQRGRHCLFSLHVLCRLYVYIGVAAGPLHGRCGSLLAVCGGDSVRGLVFSADKLHQRHVQRGSHKRVPDLFVLARVRVHSRRVRIVQRHEPDVHHVCARLRLCWCFQSACGLRLRPWFGVLVFGL